MNLTDNRLCLMMNNTNYKDKDRGDFISTLALKIFIELVLEKNGWYETTIYNKDVAEIYFAGISNYQKARSCIHNTIAEFNAVEEFIGIEKF